MATMKQKILLITILLLGSFLRFYKISSIPCLPSALAGTISILLIYILTKSFRANKASREIQRTTSWPEKYALLSAMLLAITPWSIHFSRFASEANITLFFFLLAAVLFFHWREHLRFYWLFLIGFFLLIFSFQNFNRVSQVSLFSDLDLTSVSNDFIQVNQQQNFPSLISRLFFNYRWTHLRTVLRNYLTHFHPNFLFLGENHFSHYHAPENGFLLYFSAPFLLIGLYQLTHASNLVCRQAGFASRTSRLIFGWLLIVPLAATLTTDAPMAIQAQLMLIPLTLITAYGLYYFSKQKKTILIILFSIFLILNSIYYLQHYFINLPREQNLEWQVGYQSLSQVVEDHSINNVQ